MEVFEEKELKSLYKPQDVGKGGNGQIVIIGGSSLFHGAPLFALKTASRIVDMVFFSSPESSLSEIASRLKSKLNSFIWVPFEQIEEYLGKADAILIGPGLMRYHHEGRIEDDAAGQESKRITEQLLKKFPQKQWVIDAGSLQVMEPKFIPPKAILTPNKKEYKILFGQEKPQAVAQKYDCVVVFKNASTEVFSKKESRLVKGGNSGLIKGGTGDVLAGLSLALAAKNEPFFSACAASFIVKKAADELYQKVGFAYNADDLAEKIPEVIGNFLR
jgi:NAD(P)H-hydrate epimerase